MHVRNLSHHLMWKETWKTMRNERMGKPNVTYDNAFFQKSSEDFSRRIKFNDYESGRKSTAILSDLVDGRSRVLEIGTGPGTLTIPLSKKVTRIVGIERSEKQIDYLKANLKEAGLDNVEIIHMNWEEVDHDEMTDAFDLVVCSHFLWQVEDLEKLLQTMENASKGFCALLQPCGRDEIVGSIFEKLGEQRYAGQFEPDADYFAYAILREWGRLVNVRYVHYTFERDLEEQIRYVAGFIGRFYEVNLDVSEMIRDFLIKKSGNGRYKEDNTASVMWWKP